MQGALAAAFAARRTVTETVTIDAGRTATPSPARSPQPVSIPVPPRPAGFPAGLANSGALCYLNTLLQLLYAETTFRQRVLSWVPLNLSEVMEERRSVPVQLGRLFASLQLTRRSCISTANLIGAFGWRNDEAFVQNDAHECLTVLLDTLLRDGGTTLVEPFCGSVEHFVRCSACGTESKRDELFTSLTIPVHGNANVRAALGNLLESEQLTGSNAYSCDVCSCMRDAVKGIRLREEALPSALLLHLNRFDFDAETLTRRKVRDPLAVDSSISLPTTSGSLVDYKLAGLAVHLGPSAGSGHYTAYVLARSTPVPVGDGEGADHIHWWSFNDGDVKWLPTTLARVVLGDIASAAAVSSATDAADPEAGTAWSKLSEGVTASPVHVADAAARGAYLLLYIKAADWQAHFAESTVVPDRLRTAVDSDNIFYDNTVAVYVAQCAQRRLRIFYDRSPGDTVEDVLSSRSGFGSNRGISLRDSSLSLNCSTPILPMESLPDTSPLTRDHDGSLPAVQRPRVNVADRYRCIDNVHQHSKSPLPHASVDITLRETADVDELLRAAVVASASALEKEVVASPSTSINDLRDKYRLRLYHPGRGMPLAPLMDENCLLIPTTLPTLASLKLGVSAVTVATPEPLFLERRSIANANWPAWRKGLVPFSVLAAPWLGAAQGLGPPVRIVVLSGETTVGALRLAIADSMIDGDINRAGGGISTSIFVENVAESCTPRHSTAEHVKLVLLRDEAAAKDAGTELAIHLVDDTALLVLIESGAQRGDVTRGVDQLHMTNRLLLCDAERIAVIHETAVAATPARAADLSQRGDAQAPLVTSVERWWEATVHEISVEVVAATAPAHGGSLLLSPIVERLPLHLSFDRRVADVAELRASVAAALQIPTAEFKLREASNGLELKNGARLLCAVSRSGTEACVTVESGRPMVAEEVAFLVVLYMPGDTPSTLPLGVVVLLPSMTTAEAKVEIVRQLGATRSLPPSWPEYFCIRERGAGGILSTLYVDNATLHRCSGGRVSDGKEIIVQPTSADAAVVRSGDIPVRVRRWHPAAVPASISDAVEVVINTASVQFAAAASQARNKLGFNNDKALAIAKVAAWQLTAGADHTYAAIKSAAWVRVDFTPPQDTAEAPPPMAVPLTQCVLPRIAGGDTLLLTTIDEYHAECEARQADRDAAPAAPSRTYKSEEAVGFRIFNPQEQAERETAAAIAAEAFTSAAQPSEKPRLSFLGELRSRN